MGTLRFAPSADSGVLSLLGEIYDLQPLSGAAGSSNGAVGPILLGSGDMGDEETLSSLQETHGAGQAVVITNATQTDAENLRLTEHLTDSASAVSSGHKVRRVQRAHTAREPRDLGLSPAAPLFGRGLWRRRRL